MSSNSTVADFYDGFTENQTNIGISVRHRLIFKKLKQIGLTKKSNVLEIGCGIGTVSQLIIKYITEGQFVGCDISPKSIEIAQKLNSNKNAEFICTDMSTFDHKLKFDFFVFPDVLEHIPVEQHSNIFSLIAKHSKPSSKVLINIPEPESLDWYRKNKPELLQIIDQSLSMQDLLNNSYPHGFKVESIIPYSIHTNIANYFSIVLYRERKISEIKLKNKFANLTQNIKAKI